jgi:hypothetical protein
MIPSLTTLDSIQRTHMKLQNPRIFGKDERAPAPGNLAQMGNSDRNADDEVERAGASTARKGKMAAGRGNPPLVGCTPTLLSRSTWCPLYMGLSY